MSGYKNTDLISIVIPAYNHEDYIDRCIDSIIAQSYEDIELIIVNDGSTDSTAEKIKARIKECEKRFKRFVFIDKDNEGPIKSFNRGAFEARGKYLSVCASDDAYAPSAIEVFHAFLSKNPDYVLVVGDNHIMDSDGKTCFWSKKRNNTYDRKKARFKTFGEMLKKRRSDIDFASEEFGTYSSFLKGNYITNGYLFKTDVFVKEIGGYSEKAQLEDFYLHLQLSKYGKYKYIDEPLFYYRWHGSNASLKRDKIMKAAKDTFLLEEKYAYENGFKDIFDEYKIGKIKKSGVPFLFELKKQSSVNQKTFTLRILGFKIFEKNKSEVSNIIKIMCIPIIKKQYG